MIKLQFILSFLFAFYFLSPDTSIPILPENVSAQETKTETGSMESWVVSQVQVRGKENTTKSKTWDNKKSVNTVRPSSCNSECKIETLKDLGIRPEITESLVNNCKALADDPRRCVIAWASIVISESGWGWKCRKNNKYNCFWIMQNNDYKSYNDATSHFAGKFQKWWRNAKSASFFYPSKWNVSPSRFCTSGDSSNSSIWCPNGQKNAQIIWDKLEKLF